MRYILLWVMALALGLTGLTAHGESGDTLKMEALFPYALTQSGFRAVPVGSSQLLYIHLESFRIPKERPAHITVSLPEGLTAVPQSGWRISANGGTAETDWRLPADYGQRFDVLSVKTADTIPVGIHTIQILAEGDGWRLGKELSFEAEPAAQEEKNAGRKLDHPQFSWYIQNAVLPVDGQGKQDSRQERGSIYLRDVTLENIRSRFTGGGAVNWAHVFSEPVTYVLLELRNPKRDTRSLHFKAELTDRLTGKVMPGLVTASGEDENGAAVSRPEEGNHASEALIGLDGQIMQSVVIPLYADPYAAEEGEYSLRITVWDGAESKTIEAPVTVVRKKSVGLLSVGFALFCLAVTACSLGALKRCIIRIGARGDITVALFAALAFGGVVVPVTLLGDFLQVILGPFAGLATGLLSGVLMYLLMTALLMLFRRPGVAALFFLIKWLLAGILFGRFTPVGILSYAVYIVIIEGALWAAGFYRKKEITPRYAVFMAGLLGVCDAAITLINMEQLMFFYRLYYADWFIALYMMINGLLYSSAGSWMGYRIGTRLRQVMSE